MGIQRHTGVGFELVLDPDVPQMAEQLVEVVAPRARSVSRFPRRWLKYIAPAPAVLQAPTPVVEIIAPAPQGLQAPSLVVQYSSPVPAVQAPAPVGFLSPAPAVFRVGGLQEDRVPPLVVHMIFFSLLGGAAQMMRLAV